MEIQGRGAQVIRSSAIVAAAVCLAVADARAAASNETSGEQSLNQTAGDSRHYNLTFRSLTDFVAPGLYAYMTVTRIDGSNCRALMLLNRHGGDRPNRPIGLFGTTLSRDDTDAIGATIDAIRWQDLPAPTTGEISAATLELEYHHGEHEVRQTFNAGNVGLQHPSLRPMMQRLDEIGGTLLMHPERTVSVAIARTDRGFKLILKNTGDGPVIIADPRPSTGAEAAGRGVVGVANAPDQTAGFQPVPALTPIPLKAIAAGAPAIILAPGQAFEAETVAWTAPMAGRYFAKGSWIDYTGPKSEPGTVMPVIPDPGAEAGDKRPYPIRGAAFSGYLQFNSN